ncbi:MAG: formate dehydrogenase accessory sulfurtransferase FdhD [Sedimentisphaerales bacterium]|nr:formate dehydrogenase accessory sulfurtransferase FdhD [Sedimentisphaerales bacterium]
MSLVWTISGTGRKVGKTTLAQNLSKTLPNAVYAKCGHGDRTASKPKNFFTDLEQLNEFISTARESFDHLVVESNALAKTEASDITVFIDATPSKTNYRPDCEKLRACADIIIARDNDLSVYKNILSGKLSSNKLVNAVYNSLANQQAYISSQPTKALNNIEIVHLSGNSIPVNKQDDVAVEVPLTIMIDKVGSFTILSTPCDTEALAVGFLFSEGMIDSIDDIVDITVKPDLYDTIGIHIHDPSRITISRNMIVGSSCGMCGARNIETSLKTIPPVEQSLSITKDTILKIASDMHNSQRLFEQTGATHSAGIFDKTGRIISVSEDIARHNALDKAIGKCLIEKIPMQSSGVVLSGRVSFEMVAKSARIGAEIIIAVSAPSSLAITAAEKWNITLCGFVRPGKTNIYTHKGRIRELA